MRLFTFSSKSFFYIFLFSFLSLLILSSFYSLEFCYDGRLKYEERLNQFWLYKTRIWSPKSFDVVIVGDSRVYRGVSPQIIEERLDGRVANFGFSSGGLNQFVFSKAMELLNSQKKFRALVIGVTPYALTNEANRNDQLNQYLNMSEAQVFSQRYLSYFNKFFVKRSFFDPSCKEKSRSFSKRNYVQKIYPKTGWIASDYKKRDESFALKAYKSHFKNNKVSKRWVNELLESIRLARSQGIFVLAFRPPTTDAMETLESREAGVNFSELIGEIKGAGAEWVSFDPSLSFISYDGSHLEKESALLLSEHLAQKLLMQK